jgi:hypothetical protein
VGKRSRRQQTGPDPGACLDLFVLRVNELQDTAIAKRGFTFKVWPEDNSKKDAEFPDRNEFITFLALFRQFYLHANEPIEVHRVAAAFRACVADDELLMYLGQLEPRLDAPFQPSLRLSVAGREFSPGDLMEAWVSRYLHADRVPAELVGIAEAEWQFRISPLIQYFYVGIQVLEHLKRLILEAKRRNALRQLSSNRPVV